MKSHDRQGGNALFVVALLVVAVGLILAGTMAYRDARHDRVEYMSTLDRMDAINRSIYSFALAAGRLPCPSPPSPQGGINPGEEWLGCDANTNGIVPWRALGLPESIVSDEWNRRISYRLDHLLVTPSSAVAGATINDAAGLDVCRDAAAPASCGIENTVGYLLVSHGKSGEGGWLPAGAKMGTAPAAGEYEGYNARSPGESLSATYYHLSETPPSSPLSYFFDDIVALPKDPATKQTLDLPRLKQLLCKSPRVWNVGAGSCECPAGSWDGAVCVPTTSCPAGATGTYPTCTCTTGTYNPSTNQCDPAAPTCPTGATGTPPNCTCGGGQSYSPSSNTCVPTPPNCPPTATGSPPACTCAASGTVYDIGSNTCVVQNSCPSGATGTPPACTCTTGLYDASTNICSTVCPTNSSGTVPNCTCNAGFEMVGGTCQTQPVFTAPGGGGTSSFVPGGITPGSPHTSSYTVATTVNGQPALNLYSPTGELIGTVTADMGVDNTSVNSALTWNASTGLGVSSSGGGGPGGGPNAAMERSEGVVMNFTSYFRSIALTMFDLQGTATATGTNDIVFVYLFQRADPTSTDAIPEANALRQFALPACSSSNNTFALFSSLMAGQGKLFDVMKVAVQADSNNNVKNNIYAMSLSGTASATMTITGALSPCTVWYCDTPNTCGPAARPWRVYNAASPG